MKDERMLSAVRARLDALAEENGGALTPEIVVADAESPGSPLHGYFEWDDGAAAREYRIVQARRLIRSVRLEVRVEQITLRVPAYVRDPKLPPQRQGYLSTVSLRDREAEAREVVHQELERVISALRRAEQLARVIGMAAVLEGLLAHALTLRDELDAA